MGALSTGSSVAYCHHDPLSTSFSVVGVFGPIQPFPRGPLSYGCTCAGDACPLARRFLCVRHPSFVPCSPSRCLPPRRRSTLSAPRSLTTAGGWNGERADEYRFSDHRTGENRSPTEPAVE